MERKKFYLFLPIFAACAIFAGGMLYADVDVVAEGGKAAAGIDRAALKAEIIEELRVEMLEEARAERAAAPLAAVPEVSQSAISAALEESAILSGLFKGTTVSGYLETIFTYNLRQSGEDDDRTLASTGLSNADIGGWNYLGERNDNSFALEAFAIFFDKATTDEHPIGWQAHLYFGEKAKRITFLGAGGFNATETGTGTDDTARNDIVTISAANITWDAPVLGRTVPITMGKMYTWIGYELVENIGNPNYSHGLIYNNAIPFTHMGASFDVSEFIPSDKLGLTLYYVNGWDSFIDNNKSKSFGAYLTYEPNDDTFISLAMITGNEGWNVREGDAGAGQSYVSANNGGATTMFDIVATYALPQVEKLSLGANFDWGYIEDFNAHDGVSRPETISGAGGGTTVTGTSGAHWWAAAGYAMYDFTDNQMGALRYEYMDDQDHARTFGYSIWDLTYTHNITVAENLMIRPEIRYIKHNTIEGDNEPSHGDTDGDGSGLQNDSETILTLGVEYVF